MTGEVEINIVCTHNVQAAPHEISMKFQVDQDSPSSSPYTRSQETMVLALRAMADHFDQMISGPPIAGTVTPV